MPRLRISYNAPVVLTFALLAVLVQALASMQIKQEWFVTPGHGLHGFSSYVGLFAHVLGHGNWQHLIGNFMLILLLGPILEERYGSMSLLVMILITALVNGLVDLVLGDHTLGASGIVFMMIVLASTANIRAGEIPLTFIAVMLVYVGAEIAKSFEKDQVSQLAHILGGVSGAVFGFLHAKNKEPEKKPLRTALPGAPLADLKLSTTTTPRKPPAP